MFGMMPSLQPHETQSFHKVFRMELDKNPINCENMLKMKPKIRMDCANTRFEMVMSIPGFESEDIGVFAGNGKVVIKAIDRVRIKNFNICKVYKADYTLPSGAIIEKLRKSYKDDTLCIRGEIQKTCR